LKILASSSGELGEANALAGIHSILLPFVTMKKINLFNRKSLKSFRSSLRNRSTSAEAALWERNLLLSLTELPMVNIIEYRKMKTGINTINHPGRDQSLQYIYYHSTPATPPSKGGENIIALNFTIIID